MYIVYMATSPSGKKYIGKTRRSKEGRWYAHVWEAAQGSSRILAKAIRKYGAASFTLVEVAQCVDNREACAVERGLIAQYGTLSPNGYNLTVGGEGVGGWKHRPETKERMRQLKLGRGFVRSEAQNAHVREMGANNRGRVMTAEHKAAVVGNLELGRGPKSPEVRAAISAGNKKRMEADPELRATCIANMQSLSPERRAEKGRAHSLTMRARGAADPLAYAHLHTPEAKAKRLAAHRETLKNRPYRPEDPEVTKRRVAISVRTRRRNKLYEAALAERGGYARRAAARDVITQRFIAAQLW